MPELNKKAYDLHGKRDLYYTCNISIYSKYGIDFYYAKSDNVIKKSFKLQ